MLDAAIRRLLAPGAAPPPAAWALRTDAYHAVQGRAAGAIETLGGRAP